MPVHYSYDLTKKKSAIPLSCGCFLQFLMFYFMQVIVLNRLRGEKVDFFDDFFISVSCCKLMMFKKILKIVVNFL